MNTNTETNDEFDLDAEIAALMTAATEDDGADVIAVAGTDEEEVDLEEIEAAATVAEAKDAAYAESKPDEDAEELTGTTPAPKAGKKKSATVTVLTAGAPIKSSQPSALLGSKFNRDQLLRAAYMVTGDDSLGEEEALAQFNDKLDKLAKKVGSKAVNLIVNLERPSKVETYTAQALDALLDKGELSNVDFAAVFGRYSLGTMRSQSSQIFQLFPALGIAARDGSKLVLNPLNPLVETYAKAKTAAPVAAAA